MSTIITGEDTAHILEFPMPAPANFPERLRALRKKLNLSQTELGKRVGVHYTHIGRYEAGKSAPAAETLRRLADALQVTADFLIDGAANDNARARLTDNDLLRAFQQVEALPAEDKATIKKLLDAFLAMQQIRGITSQAS